MKFDKKNMLLGLVIGLVLISGAGVLAATYFDAIDITFIPSNENWEVTNVKEAIDELYSNAQKVENIPETITLSGNWSASASQNTGGTSGNGNGKVIIPTYGFKYADITITSTNTKSGSYSFSSSVGTGNDVDISSVTDFTISWNAGCNQNGSPNALSASGTYTVILHN